MKDTRGPPDLRNVNAKLGELGYGDDDRKKRDPEGKLKPTTDLATTVRGITQNTVIYSLPLQFWLSSVCIPSPAVQARLDSVGWLYFTHIRHK